MPVPDAGSQSIIFPTRSVPRGRTVCPPQFAIRCDTPRCVAHHPIDWSEICRTRCFRSMFCIPHLSPILIRFNTLASHASQPRLVANFLHCEKPGGSLSGASGLWSVHMTVHSGEHDEARKTS